MNETIPPTNPSEAQAQAAAEAERRAPPVPPTGPAPSPSLRGPYPPVPYGPYAPDAVPAGPSGSPLRGGRERQRVSPWVVVVGSILVLFAFLMCAGSLLVGAIEGMAWAAGPVQATETRSFTVSGAPTLSLDVSAGNVHIVPGSNGQVTMSLHKQAQAITHSAAEQALAAMSLDATQSGNIISVHVGQPNFYGFPWVPNHSLDLTVNVPASSNLELTLTADNFDARGISGTLTGHITAGNVDLNDLTLSGDSSLHLTAGNIKYRGALAPGASLDVEVAAGNVDIALPRTTSTHVQASATSGNVNFSGWPGVSATRSGPNATSSVDLNPPTTSTLSVQVTAGNVTIRAVG